MAGFCSLPPQKERETARVASAISRYSLHALSHPRFFSHCHYPEETATINNSHISWYSVQRRTRYYTILHHYINFTRLFPYFFWWKIFSCNFHYYAIIMCYTWQRRLQFSNISWSIIHDFSLWTSIQSINF